MLLLLLLLLFKMRSFSLIAWACVLTRLMPALDAFPAP